ncbi:LpqB family beta-propeller domain-containing protein [Geodermatophilus sp. DSM 44513]|uniref:LpqB family beta-propeller domain-containing protein n=1 Tax=Geodermatophilus sp. DSM 44513 TaxID=1528104 RepID=UPI00127FB380|nr:LpqB family beta-propeller domain-containing protein [Geodermatophilus sp. DSM 44513]WNV74746.1 LpqB family beta-propeller domain-containing protein [Geodermatophilus sp. DSM 44513]
MRVVSAAVLVALSTACSTVPTSSPTVQITQEPPRSDGPVGIEPDSPEPDATPEEVVRGFIEATASTVVTHPVAREHLAPEPAGSWADDAGITLLGADYATVTTDTGTVVVTGELVGRIDQRGGFTVGGEEVYRQEFRLEQVDGQWRISDPPDGLLMLQPDFQRLYERLDLYFLDPTGSRVVPDPRYLIDGDALPTVLVDRLLDGPSAVLAAGVRNALDDPALADARLGSAVEVSGPVVRVDLTGVADGPPALLAELSAQLVWTLGQLESVRSVEVLADGEPLALDGVPSVQTVDTWASLDPDAAPVDAVGHYLEAGALRRATDPPAPAPGPAGEGAYGLTSAAVATDPSTGGLTDMVGVTERDGQATLLAGPYGGDLTPVLSSGSLTVPTVAATREEFWLVRDGSTVVRLPTGGPPQAVNAVTLPGLGRVTALQLSPDGVRAAVVVEDGQRLGVHVGTVVRSDDDPVALRDWREVTPTVGQVTDVAWRTSGSLLLLAGDAGRERTVPYTVGVDGWDLAPVPTAGLPSQATRVAAAPGRPPLVSAGGAIWEWQAAGGTWVTLVRGQQPQPGTEPFYPV